MKSDEQERAAIWIVADLLLDAVVRLESAEVLIPASDHQAHTSVDLVPGGGALHAAIGAADAGFSPIHVIAAIGQLAPQARNADAAAKLFTNTFDHRVQVHLDVQDTSIAIAVLVHAGLEARLLFSRASPYELRLDHVLSTFACDVPASPKFLYMSGYVLFDPRRTLTAQEVLRQARDRGMTTVVDVVPHRLHARISRDAFVAATSNADVLISETSTLTRLLEQADPSSLPTPNDLILFDSGMYTIRRRGAALVRGKGPDEPGPHRGMHDRFAMRLLVAYFVETGQQRG